MVTTSLAIEGYPVAQFLALPPEQVDAFIFCGTPIAFTLGTARMLAEFRRTATTLVVEVAHIDGGGEGVLPTLWMLATKHAQRIGLTRMEWIVHATHCADPNVRLQRVLKRKGFVVEDVPGAGLAYRRVVGLTPSAT